jgi:polyhydroxybutyrate depolymerase
VTAHRKWIIGVPLALLLGCNRRAETKFGNEEGTSAPTYVERSLVQGAWTRAWHVKIPRAAREGRALPLVVALHGGGGSGDTMNALSGLDVTAEREGFFVAYPDGVDKHWNDGRLDVHSTAHSEDVPDVAFLSEMIDDLEKAYRIDPARVFAAGISNGAMMSCRLACELSDKIAGVAMVAGSMPRSIQPSCAPRRPVSVMILHGTDDPLVPYGGGEVHARNLRARGMVLGVQATISEWLKHDRCEGAPEEEQLPDRNGEDGSVVRVQKWRRCAEGTSVELWTIQGGGHTWPGGWQYMNERFIGTTNRDIEGREVIWRFFAAHPRA